MKQNKHIDNLHLIIYYLVLLISGLAIYKFEIEKSFNLLPVYCSVIAIILIKNFTDKYTKYILPGVFLALLYYFYPGIKFLYLVSFISLLLIILIPKYPLSLKIAILLFVGFILTFIYIIPNDYFRTIKYIPYIIGSLFMFRSVSFIHEMRYYKNEIPLIDKINYFLLLPNLSMPLFPIVNFKIFISSYHEFSFKQLKRGTLLIIKGIFQLLIYRFIYHYMVSPISQIHHVAGFFLYIASSFLIILRVIGAYHIGIGLITLYGYNMPDLFNNIFFSTGFSDLWRRTNMYWKDFIIKIFYYPIYFKIKNKGEYLAIIIATLSCFFITWMLHNYQWFWLKGTFPLDLKDLIFWGVFGILVTTSSVLQHRKLLHKETKKSTPTIYMVIKNTLNGLVVFISMSILWSIWVAPDLKSWNILLHKSFIFDRSSLFMLFIYITLYLVIAFVYHYYQKTKLSSSKFISNHIESFSIYPYLTVIFILFSLQAYKFKSKYYRFMIDSIVYEKLNKADKENIDNGYYSNLISTNDYCSQVWSTKVDDIKNKTVYINENLTYKTDDMFSRKFIPNKKLLIDDYYFSINSVGLHDKEYEKIKPKNTYRIIVLGGSVECGTGVKDDEDFISLVEKELEKKYTITNKGIPVKVEIINLSSNGYMLLQRMYVYKNRADEFDPDATLLFLHTNYYKRTVNNIARILIHQRSVEDPYLNQLIIKNKLSKLDNEETISSKLGFYVDSLNNYALANIIQMTQKDSVKLVSVFLPLVSEKVTPAELSNFQSYSNKYHYPLINLENIYKGYEKKLYKISETDAHPNKLANDLIAKKLLENIILQQNSLNLNITKK